MRHMVEKSVKNYIEWFSQRTKRLVVGPSYEDTMINVEADVGFFDCFFGISVCPYPGHTSTNSDANTGVQWWR